MGLFTKKPRVDPEEVRALRADMADLRSKLDASERSRQLLEVRMQTLDVTTSALSERTHLLDDVTQRMAEVDVIKRQVAQLDVVNAKITSLDGLNGRMTELTERMHTSSADAQHAKAQAALLSDRIASVSTEVVNQLSELGREIDAITSKQENVAVVPVIQTHQLFTEQTLDELRQAQVRLANEQARYEIAFRQDLALLAEQVKRSRSN
jgi:uncharacterized protein YoxC